MSDRKSLMESYTQAVQECLNGGPFHPLFLYESEAQELEKQFPNLKLAKLITYDDGMSHYEIVREPHK